MLYRLQISQSKIIEDGQESLLTMLAELSAYSNFPPLNNSFLHPETGDPLIHIYEYELEEADYIILVLKYGYLKNKIAQCVAL